MPTDSTAAPDATPHPDKFPWVSILILGFAWFLAVAVELGPAGLLNDIADDLNISLAAVGTMTTFYALGNAVLVLPLTALAIKYARRTALNVVMLVFVGSNVLVALSPSLVVADIGRFIGGASYALICTLFPAVVVSICGPRFAARGITVVFTATSLGVALGAPLASLVGNSVGWRLVFLAAAALAFIAGILMSLIVPRVRDSTRESLTLMQTVRLRGVLRTAVGWSLVMLAHFVVLTYVEAYLEEMGFPPFIASVTLFIIGVGGIVGTIVISPISRRSVSAALIIAPAVVAVGLALLYMGGPNLAVALIGIGLWGVGLAATVVIYQQTILLTGARAPETATSIGVLLAQAGFAVGSTIGGITITVAGVRTVPLVALAFVLGSVAIATSLRRVIHATDSQGMTAGRAREVLAPDCSATAAESA